MAQPSTSTSTASPFTRLPPEIRTVIFTELFSSLHVTVHNDFGSTRCLSKDSSCRTSSYCNVLLVSKQYREEVKENFMRFSTFWITSDCWSDVIDDRALVQLAMVKKIVLTPDKVHSPDIDFTVALPTLQKFQHSLSTGGPLNQKFTVLTYDRTFFDDWDAEWEAQRSPDEGNLRRFVPSALQCAETLVFDMFPAEENPIVRSCGVSINTTANSISIIGFSRRDVRGVAIRLCRLIKFDASMTCHLEYPGGTAVAAVQEFSRRKRR